MDDDPQPGSTGIGATPPAPSTARSRLFSAGELRLFRYTAVLLSLVTLVALTALIAWALGWMLGTFYNLLLPLSVAGILALVLHPVVAFLQRRLHLSRLLATLLVLAILSAALGGLLFLLLPLLVTQAIQLMTVLPGTLAAWQAHFTAQFPELSAMLLADAATGESAVVQPSMPDLNASGRTVMNYLGLLAGISFVPLFLFFTLLSGDLLRRQASELLSVFPSRTQRKVLYFMEVFVGYVTAFFQGQLLIAVSMGVLYALSFALIGLKFGVLAGLVLGLLNIVPFLGTLIGMLIILPMAYLQPGGSVQLLVMTAIAFALVQLIESWLLTPKIMGNRSGLHPALVVISLFFWGTALGGITGMVLAVPLTAFLVAIWSEIKSSLEHALGSRNRGGSLK